MKILMFILGAICFLALNPVIYRLPKKREWSKSRWRYGLIAILGGVLTLGLYEYFGIGVRFGTYFLFLCVLLVIAFVDQDTMEIPFVLNVVILLLGIVSIWSVGGLSLVERLAGMLCISLPLYLIVLVIPDGFGGGDIKLMFAAGFLLGWKATVTAFFVATILGGIYGILSLIRRKMGKKDHFAFGPFLCVGLTLTVFYGGFLVEAYGEYLQSLMS